MNDKKVIFLDIDGVLNYQSCKERFDKYYFVSDKKIELLKQLVDKTDAKIVLSSTWRYGWVNPPNEDTPMYEALKKKLESYGIIISDKTPVIGYRGTEIDEWLMRHPEVDKFVIFDDNQGLKPHGNHHIQTSWKYGLLEKHIKLAEEILNKEN